MSCTDPLAATRLPHAIAAGAVRAMNAVTRLARTAIRRTVYLPGRDRLRSLTTGVDARFPVRSGNLLGNPVTPTGGRQMGRSLRSALVVAGVAAAVLAINAAPALAASNPDGQIRVKGQGSFVGKHVFNTTGVGQTVKRKVNGGKAAKFEVKAKNSGTQTDDIRLYLSPNVSSCAEVTVKVYLNGVNRTTDMLMGKLVADDVPVGGSTPTYVVKAKTTSAADGTCPIKAYFNTVDDAFTTD